MVFLWEFWWIVFISPLRSLFAVKRPPKCLRMESSSVLKRPSDSNSALVSVTPRDHLVYASGSVRSTASNNAPYMDRVRRKQREWKRERERRHGTHTHPDVPAIWTAHMRLWRNSKRHETQRELLPGSLPHIHAHTWNSIEWCLVVCLLCFGWSNRNELFQFKLINLL